MFKNLSLDEIYNREEPFDSLVPGTGIVLIGKAAKGPSMIPVRVDTEDDAQRVFGSDSDLTNAYREAAMAGGGQIYLVRINGKHAQTNVQDLMTLTSTEAVASANTFQYQITTSGQNRFLLFMNAMTGYTASYLITGKKISDIAAEINIEAAVVGAPVYATILRDEESSSLVDELFSGAQTEGADEELNLVTYAESICMMLEYLSSYPIGQIGILCEIFNRVYDNTYLYQKIADFAQWKVRASTPCIVTIGMSRAYIDAGYAYDAAKAFKTVLTTECPVSEYINVVVAEPVFPSLSSDYRSNGVAAYCGLLDIIEYSESSTNKVVTGAVNDKIPLDDTQKAELASLGYVVFKNTVYAGEKQVRVWRGCNLTRQTTRVINPNDLSQSVRNIPAPMSNVGNVRLVQSILYKLHDIVDEEEMTEISTLQSKVEAVLQTESRNISSYTVTESSVYQGFARNLIVSIEITPIGELESISISVQAQ